MSSALLGSEWNCDPRSWYAHPSGKLDVDYTDRTYDDQAGTQLSRRRLRKVFHGDIEGESTGEFLMAMAPNGAAAYVGIDRVTATISGASGSFILVHSATRSADGETAEIVALPDSATDELVDLRGKLTIVLEPDGTHATPSITSLAAREDLRLTESCRCSTAALWDRL